MNSVKLNGLTITPSKIICIGRNYVEHIKELENEIPTEPVIFIKPNSAISDTLVSGTAEEIHYEGEICFLIKDKHIAAVGFGLDLTKRAVQSRLKAKGLPWERAKSFDKSVVFSEFVECKRNLALYKMELFINDQLVQQGNYELMLHKPEQLLSEISDSFTMEDGDIIMTGTPKGVGLVNAGDTFLAKLYEGNDLLIERKWQTN